ncbi:MAG: DegT/DnrJ/EryC1/StrS family aminotransferase [Negativicutes bacterium]|nr:DegT/DnrJ/EryC1/StrS family aminotransferase [Negativicutes bacterium]
MEFIPVFRPLLGCEEKEACNQVLDIGWLGMGKNVGEFENELQNFIETKDRFVACVSTGHAALHLGLIVAGVGPGDEVITPSFNNIADFQAILATGASPVFCDIENDTLCIDLDKAEKLITPRTKALIVMDYDCVLCDHDRIRDLAEKYNLRVIHDAAHSFGSRYKGKRIGSFSDICMFSFDPVKTLTCIDGGALIVRSEEEIEKIYEMRLVGMGQPPKIMYQNQRAWTYDVRHIGYRYHMANLHAKIGSAQLAKFNEISSSRQFVCKYYNEQFKELEKVVTPKTDFNDITPFLYYIRVPASVREGLREHLRELNIDTGIHWQPGHWFSLFKNCRKGDLSVTDTIGNEILSLPLHSCMNDEHIERVVKGLKSFNWG